MIESAKGISSRTSEFLSRNADSIKEEVAHTVGVGIFLSFLRVVMPSMCADKSETVRRICATGPDDFDCKSIKVIERVYCATSETLAEFGVLKSTLVLSLTGIAIAALTVGTKKIASRLSSGTRDLSSTWSKGSWVNNMIHKRPTVAESTSDYVKKATIYAATCTIRIVLFASIAAIFARTYDRRCTSLKSLCNSEEGSYLGCFLIKPLKWTTCGLGGASSVIANTVLGQSNANAIADWYAKGVSVISFS